MIHQPSRSSHEVAQANTNHREATTQKKRKSNQTTKKNEKRQRTNVCNGESFLNIEIFVNFKIHEVDDDRHHAHIYPAVVNEQNTKGKQVYRSYIYTATCICVMLN